VKPKMIAIDLDGTLLSPNGEVTARTRAAVQGALEAGLKVCFATGRNFTESRTVLDAVGHRDLAVFVGGAVIVDTASGRVVHRTLMHGDLARELSAFFESRGQAVLALQDTTTAGVDYIISSMHETTTATKRWLTATVAKAQWHDDLAHYHHEHTLRVGIVAPSDVATAIRAEMDGIFGSRIVSHNIVVPGYGVQVIEAFDPNVNKWEGILRIAGRYEVRAADIVAIGDDVNDLAMIRSAGLGIAMGNAHPEVLSAAGRVIGPNSSDGLAKYLEELVAQN
jgi:Cof subfamily protein (haloacid dehalogenase superfamily)